MRKCAAFHVVTFLLVLILFLTIPVGKVLHAESYTDEWILPKSACMVYSQEEIDNMPVQVVCYARNEIYARHGRMFQSQELQEYFDLRSWYSGCLSPSEWSDDLLSEVERTNVERLLEREERLGEKKYQLDQARYSFDEIDRYISSRMYSEKKKYVGIAEGLIYDELMGILSTNNFEMEIPVEWEELFGIDNATEDSIKFYCRLVREMEGCEGTICSLNRYQEYYPEEEFPDAVYLGERGSYYYYYMRPTDVQYNPDDEEGTISYLEMEAAAEDMAETIRLK